MLPSMLLLSGKDLVPLWLTPDPVGYESIAPSCHLLYRKSYNRQAETFVRSEMLVQLSGLVTSVASSGRYRIIIAISLLVALYAINA